MNDLDYKFRKNTLSPKELIEFRKKLSEMDDENLEVLLRESWNDEEHDTTLVSAEQLNRIKGSVDANIGIESKHISFYKLAMRAAAAILLPLFVFSTIYLYQQNSEIRSEDLIVSTQQHERATITLPDGTKVTLNTQSSLSYNPKTYNQKNREIYFDGEGYFQVYKNLNRSFIINAKGLRIKVLGTVFNLSVRQIDNSAELSLEQGSVSMRSIQTGKEFVLKPNQKAIMNQQTGNIKVVSDESIVDASAWKRGDMVFRNTRFLSMIKTIEENYNITIIVNCENCERDSFTGTIPTNDLNEVLEILERSYRFKANIEGRQVTFSFN
ncbi:MAG: hypothetical protein AUK44_04485 [Porphyromonadaceae bacterium CG2_30_38_12]|nr:MAG: hypothetical protein AUK44_04485 [Porphyromonadaceae bacterium CG2_30_38_12]